MVRNACVLLRSSLLCSHAACACRERETQPEGQRLVVVALSANVLDEHVRECIEHGAQRFRAPARVPPCSQLPAAGCRLPAASCQLPACLRAASFAACSRVVELLQAWMRTSASHCVPTRSRSCGATSRARQRHHRRGRRRRTRDEGEAGSGRRRFYRCSAAVCVSN
jgi:CheY-like chemotaxis protein